MPHIPLPEDAFGIVGLLMSYPETAKHLSGLAQAALRGPSSLTVAEREMIATHVSSGNECQFCMNSHAAAARHLLGSACGLVDEMLADPGSDQLTDKLRALLVIAGKVRQDGRLVSAADVAAARAAGADDRAIHDTVLIAAMFCMYNRYVDGLATVPAPATVYPPMGERLATQGYQS